MVLTTSEKLIAQMNSIATRVADMAMGAMARITRTHMSDFARKSHLTAVRAVPLVLHNSIRFEVRKTQVDPRCSIADRVADIFMSASELANRCHGNSVLRSVFQRRSVEAAGGCARCCGQTGCC